jgi:hypothetical protein
MTKQNLITAVSANPTSIVEDELPWDGLDSEAEHRLKIDQQHHAYFGFQ